MIRITVDNIGSGLSNGVYSIASAHSVTCQISNIKINNTDEGSCEYFNKEESVQEVTTVYISAFACTRTLEEF